MASLVVVVLPRKSQICAIDDCLTDDESLSSLGTVYELYDVVLQNEWSNSLADSMSSNLVFLMLYQPPAVDSRGFVAFGLGNGRKRVHWRARRQCLIADPTETAEKSISFTIPFV